MRKLLKKAVAVVSATAMVATLLVGIHVPTTVKAANLLEGASWTHFHPQWEEWDGPVSETQIVDINNGFAAVIKNTGWQRMWVAEQDAPEGAIVLGANPDNPKSGNWGEKPYQLTSTTTAKVQPGTTYKFSFTVDNKMQAENTTTPSEKNVTITVDSGIEGDNNNTMLFDTVRLQPNEKKTFTYEIEISPEYTNNTIQIEIAYGSYAYSWDLTQNAGSYTQEQINKAIESGYALAYGTTEAACAHGTLTFSNISLGTDSSEDITPPPTTVDPNNALGRVEWTHFHPQWEEWDGPVSETQIMDIGNGFAAVIKNTGWQRMWVAEQDAPEGAIVLGANPDNPKSGNWGEKPYQLTSTATAKVQPGTTYKFSFTVDNKMQAENTTTPSEKNITITVNSGIEGDNNNTMLFDTVRLQPNEKKTFTYDIEISPEYTNGTIQIELAYGSYAYSWDLTQNAGSYTQEQINKAIESGYALAYGTTEAACAHGVLTFSNISLKSDQVEETTEAPETTTTTKAPETTTSNKAPEVTTSKKAPATTTKVKAPKKAKIKKINKKKKSAKKIKLTLKKISGAKGYQVAVYKTKSNAKKNKKAIVKKVVRKYKNITITSKKLKNKKKLYVAARAYKLDGKSKKYGRWSTPKKVTIKK